jgi:hypothetical protein
MGLRSFAKILSLGRAAFGAALLGAPETIGSRWIGAVAEDARTAVPLRALGARDITLGLGTVRAISDGHGATGWLLASAASDAVDLGATLAARESLPERSVAITLALAGGSAALCVAAALADG